MVKVIEFKVVSIDRSETIPVALMEPVVNPGWSKSFSIPVDFLPYADDEDTVRVGKVYKLTTL